MLRKHFGIPCQHLYSLDFLDRYEDKCITFHHNHPEEIAKGSAPLSAIYQFKRNLNGITNIATWREEGENDGQVTVYLVYEDFKDVTKFLKENMDLVKQPKKEKGIGFLVKTP
jgi:hypothetical protein